MRRSLAALIFCLATPADRYARPGGFISGDAFVETVHRSLSTPPAKHHQVISQAR